jgi:ribosomal protein S18 acetylase RimI-like enzyme
MSASASQFASESEPGLQLNPASHFSIEVLTAAYNQTRVDYLVPMPMNAARLAEYIRVYDVHLDKSFVATDSGQILGLAMLGVRPGRTWVTRLGVLPARRRRGVGRALMHALLHTGQALGAGLTVLEVIKNNAPAYNLFIQCGFHATRELLVLRRPPGPPPRPPVGEVRRLSQTEIAACLVAHPARESWIAQVESLTHVEGLMGLALTMPDDSRGTLIFEQQRHGRFIVILSRLTLLTERGEPATVGGALLTHLHHRYPELDTYAENIAMDDPHLAAFFELNYVESFRRIEMQRPSARLTASDVRHD